VLPFDRSTARALARAVWSDDGSASVYDGSSDEVRTAFELFERYVTAHGAEPPATWSTRWALDLRTPLRLFFVG